MSGKPINYMDISSCDDDDVYQVPDKDDDDDVVVTQTKAGGAKKKKNRLQSTAPASDSHSATRPTPTLQAPPPAPVVVANDSTTEDAPLFLAPTRAPRHGTSLPPLAYYDVSSEKFVGAAKGFRQAVWQHTAQIGEMGGYAVESEHGREGLWFDLKPYVRASVDGVAKFSLQRDRLPPLIAPRRGHISVFNADCLHAARRLAEEGLYPLVADAGSRAHFGGNYKGGARAQEEEMCRRSTLAFAFNKVVMPDNRNTSFYPLEPADAIYVPDVVVFREDVKSQYSLMKKPFRVAFGIIAAYCRPPLDSTGTRLTGDILAATRDMIRTFYLMAASKGHRALVIVPVGCGAFQNPASHIAELFRAPLVGTDGQPPLRGYFDEVCFAILEDHNSQHAANPNGNLLPFIHAFKDVPNTSVPRLRGSDDGERDGA